MLNGVNPYDDDPVREGGPVPTDPTIEIVRAIDRLGDRVDHGVESLRRDLDTRIESMRVEVRSASVRSDRALVVIALAILILGGALGVSTRYGTLHVGAGAVGAGAEAPRE
jgi:hypothetical protein